MRKIHVLFMSAIIVALLFQSCRKGKEDPFISFRSRSSRLIGEWNLTSGTVVSSSGETTYYNGSTASNTSSSIPFSIKWTIKKDRTIELITNSNGYTTIDSGDWSFGYKSKERDLKNKEYIIVRVNKRKYFINGVSDGVGNYSGNSTPNYIIELIKLKNNEIIVNWTGSYSENWQNGHSGHQSGTMTFKK